MRPIIPFLLAALSCSAQKSEVILDSTIISGAERSRYQVYHLTLHAPDSTRLRIPMTLICGKHTTRLFPNRDGHVLFHVPLPHTCKLLGPFLDPVELDNSNRPNTFWGRVYFTSGVYPLPEIRFDL